MWLWPSCYPRPRLIHKILDRGVLKFVVRGDARCASQVLDRGAQADACGAAQVLDRGAKTYACGAAHVLERFAQADARGGAKELDHGAQAVARGAARCALQVLDRCAQPLLAAPLVVRRTYLIVMPRPLTAAALVVYRRAVLITRVAQAVARGGAHSASKILDRCARPLPAAPLVVRCR